MLTEIETLDFRNNKLTTLPKSLAALPKLSVLDLSGNPQLPLPREVMENANWAVLPYWRKKYASSLPVNDSMVKVVVVGEDLGILAVPCRKDRHDCERENKKLR